MSGFDVFLSHNSNDKPTVRALKQALVERGLKCWLDEEQLRPGLSWQDLLKQGIKGSGSVAVCIAADGLVPYFIPFCTCRERPPCRSLQQNQAK